MPADPCETTTAGARSDEVAVGMLRRPEIAVSGDSRLPAQKLVSPVCPSLRSRRGLSSCAAIMFERMLAAKNALLDSGSDPACLQGSSCLTEQLPSTYYCMRRQTTPGISWSFMSGSP